MGRRVATDDAWDEPEDDGDWTPDEEEEYVPEPENDGATIACPHCQKAVYEQAEQCPHCGWYISEEEEQPAKKTPWWIVLGALLCLFAVYLWIRGG